MKRICIVGDLHMRSDLPYSSSLPDGRRGEWEEVKKTIHNTAKDCDAVVLMGDNLNSKNNPSIVLREFIEFLNGFEDKEIHILTGNHEKQGFNSALDFLDKVEHPKWFVYTKPTLTTVAGIIDSMMIPYMTPATLGVETNDEGAKAILKEFPDKTYHATFAHQMISGANSRGLPVELMNEIILPLKKMQSNFCRSFFGHLHCKQNIASNVHGTGNSFTAEIGEHSKSIWIYEFNWIDMNTHTDNLIEIPLPCRGIYRVAWNGDAENTFKGIPQNSIVKCIISKKGTDIDLVKEELKRFDASIVVEQYDNERKKVHFEDGVLDLSIDSLLRLYAKEKKINYNDLKEGFDLIK
jgi:hypothetical protein